MPCDGTRFMVRWTCPTHESLVVSRSNVIDAGVKIPPTARAASCQRHHATLKRIGSLGELIGVKNIVQFEALDLSPRFALSAHVGNIV